MKINSAIVTGPTGAVGVALINELINNGTFVYVVCHRNSSRISNIPNSKLVKIIECNLNEILSLPKIIKQDVDAFFHLAWDGTYGETRDNMDLQNLNIKYAIDSVSVANILNCKVYIGVGSQSEYGHSNEIKKPHSFCNPDNFYGGAKLSASIMTRIACNEHNIRHIWCRIFSLYGPYDGDYTMIMSTIKKMLNNEECNFTKGEQVWDYIYSKDAARAFRLLAENGKNGEIYNIASGDVKTLKEYINILHECVNPKCKINFGTVPYYPHQVMNLTADISNLSNDVGFKCEYSFEDGIKDLLKQL